MMDVSCPPAVLVFVVVALVHDCTPFLDCDCGSGKETGARKQNVVVLDDDGEVDPLAGHDVW